MLSADYVVVGSGLTGATIARLLADAGREVLVVERRSHVGGNVHDVVHPSGVRIHTYGPHYFRTNAPRIRDFATRFAAFYHYEARLLTLVDGDYAHWPIVNSYIVAHAGAQWTPAFDGQPTNFEEACLAQMPAIVYERFVKGYTEKQWGVPAASLSKHLARRFDVHLDDDTRLCRHAFQGLPVGGYARWMEAILDGIPVVRNVDYLAQRSEIRYRCHLVFTGPIDEFFGFSLGRLTYRSQRRTHLYFREPQSLLPCGQVNNPDPAWGGHIRLLEWKHMMEDSEARAASGTVVTTETPFTATDPETFEYPFPDDRNRRLYETYVPMAKALPGVTICGRLGEYRYYDMDQAIGRAMKIAADLLHADRPGRGVVVPAAHAEAGLREESPHA